MDVNEIQTLFTKGTTMSKTKNPSILRVLMHLFLTMITGGFWLIVLIIWYILKRS